MHLYTQKSIKMIRTAKFDEKIPKRKRSKSFKGTTQRSEITKYKLFSEIIPNKNENYFLYATAYDYTTINLEHLSVLYFLGKISESQQTAISINEKQAYAFKFIPQIIIPDWKNINYENRSKQLFSSETFKDIVLGLKFQMLRKLPHRDELVKLNFINFINRKIKFHEEEQKYKIEMSFCDFNYEYFNDLSLQEKNTFNRRYIIGRIVPPETLHSKGRTFIEVGTKEIKKISQDLEGRTDIFIQMSQKLEYKPNWKIRQGTYEKLEKLISKSDEYYKYKLELESIQNNLRN